MSGFKLYASSVNFLPTSSESSTHLCLTICNVLPNKIFLSDDEQLNKEKQKLELYQHIIWFIFYNLDGKKDNFFTLLSPQLAIEHPIIFKFDQHVCIAICAYAVAKKSCGKFQNAFQLSETQRKHPRLGYEVGGQLLCEFCSIGFTDRVRNFIRNQGRFLFSTGI